MQRGGLTCSQIKLPFSKFEDIAGHTWSTKRYPTWTVKHGTRPVKATGRVCQVKREK